MSNSKSFKNALSHGAYASHVISPWEKAEDFKDLHEGLREEYLTSGGRSEEEDIFDLACLYWKKHRLNVAFQLAARRDAHFSKLVDAGQREGWNGIIDYIANTSHDSDASTRAGQIRAKGARAARCEGGLRPWRTSQALEIWLDQL